MLRDVSFDVEQGEVLGIIGRNGAGKSTLLKLLSRVTAPTSGQIKARGRIASLLEVGTGFHPELTGRENIYLNGAILGMTRAETKARFDEIVDFAGVEKFLGTPVKRYSSGMYVRLAFAVAAHLNPEILIVDEVLAVGDSEFQKKCLGKLKNVAEGGRTVLFVSHNMGAISSLCSRAILLSGGKIELDADVGASVDRYLLNSPSDHTQSEIKQQDSRVWLKDASLTDAHGERKTAFKFTDKITLNLTIEMREKVGGLEVGFRTSNARGIIVFSTSQQITKSSTNAMQVCCEIEPNRLAPGQYTISTGLHIPGVEMLQLNENLLGFQIEETGSPLQAYHGQDYGIVFIGCQWSLPDSNV